MTICIVDTSVFCNLLDLPAFNQEREDALLLPLAAVYETGNHSAYVADGRARRHAAERFLVEVGKAIEGKAPWTTTPLPEMHDLVTWLGEFPDCAMWGIGLADLSIIRLFERQCLLHKTSSSKFEDLAERPGEHAAAARVPGPRA